ncbi:MAG: acyltransferase domain-containing protein [Oscillospiraceae bacterium]|jgi:hypothetical protein|nr:acyltransferase domain-containing protein [Oscillospiraceae bacterium]
MTRRRFEELLKVTGRIAPNDTELYIEDLEASEKEILPKAFLLSVLDLNNVPEPKRDILFRALEGINAVPELVELSHIMAKDAIRALLRCDANEFVQPKPDCLTGFARDAYAFLYSQLCVIEGRRALRLRGVPEQYDRDIPERMTRKQLKKFVEKDDITFDDYSWDMNFYCCDIFLLDRFYFIPYKWGGELEAWRNIRTNAVQAVWKAGGLVRRDGQLNGVNGVFDEQAFLTVYEETEESVTANRVLPSGYVSNETVALNKTEWKKALREGDFLLALHIPGGEGYTPERVKNSCLLALDFYGKYYPDFNYVGFWSESWLYDEGICRILGPERNISRVQRQFYCFPTMEGGGMAKREVLHDSDADYTQLTPKSTLEKGLFKAWSNGERFHTTGMFLLSEEVPDVGAEPYR